MRHVDTFFKGYRRETMIDGAQILCNAAGEKRLKLSMKIPLTGGQLVGMPSWVSEPFDDIAKPEFAVKSIASSMELDPMILRVFALPEAEKETIVFDSVRLCSFKIEHDPDDEITLRFSAYLPRTGKFLKFADDNFESSLFIRYEAAQQSLLDDNPNIQPVDEPEDKTKMHEDWEALQSGANQHRVAIVDPQPGTLLPQDDATDDDDDEEFSEEEEVTTTTDAAPADYVAERKAALDPSRDAEFASVSSLGKKAKPRATGKRDGFGKPVAQSVQ